MALILITLLIVPHYQQMCVLYFDITKNFSAQNYFDSLLLCSLY